VTPDLLIIDAAAADDGTVYGPDPCADIPLHTPGRRPAGYWNDGHTRLLD